MQSKKGLNVLSVFDGISCGQIALERAGIKCDKYYASEIDKHAIKVTMANYPDTIQIGDVTKVKGTDLPKIDLLIGGSPCFVSGTKIITSESLTPIEAVRVGDEVLTHKGLYRKVLRVGGKTSEIYELQSQSGTLTETTENHPYYVRKRIKVWNNENRSYEFKFNEPEFVKVKDLTNDHYLATPILKSAKNPMELTEDECFVIGLYIGDGHTRKDFRKSEGRDNHRHWQLIISVGEHEKDLFSEKVKLKHSLYRHTRSTYRAVFSSKRLVSYVEEHCGCSAHTKHFGKGILDLPTHLLKKVIEGYLFADGSFRGNVHRATTVSRSLVESLTLAVAKTFRTTTSVEYTKRPKTTEIQGRVVNQSDTWTVSFRENHPKQSRSWVLGDFIWNPIKKLIKTDKKKPVFNLEVEEDNSYVANNHVVHNCQGFSFAGKQLNFDDPRSKLFFEFVRLLRECNPKYFLLENVKMKKEYEDVITDHLGVEPIFINSSLLSAQNRKRIYWTNIPGVTIPNDKGIMLKDIVHEYVDAMGFEELAEYIVPFDKTLQILDKEVERGKVGYFRKDSQANRVYYIHDKAVTLCGEAGGGAAKMGQYLFGHTKKNSQGNRVYAEEEKSACLNASSGGTAGAGNILFGCITPDRINKRQNGQRFNDGKKFYTLTAQDKHGILIEGYIRKLTPVECERLQTVNTIYEIGVSLWLDQAKNYVNAVEKNHKLRKLVLSVESDKLQESVKIVDKNTKLKNQKIKSIAQKSAGTLIQKQTRRCTKMNQKEQHLNADTVEGKTMSNYQNIGVGFAILNVFTNLIQEKTIHNGEVELHLKDKNTPLQKNGSKQLKMSGEEIMRLVEIADIILEKQEIEPCTYTTLYHLNIKNIEQMLIILYWFAKSVIDLSTLKKIKIKNILLNYEFEESYTAHVSNTQRYKMLGNGFTVDVIAHIFKGIKDV